VTTGENAATGGVREIIERALAANPHASNRQLVREIGLEHETVASIAGQIRAEAGDGDYRGNDPQLTKKEAVALTEKIKDDLQSAFLQLIRAWRGRADKALGYSSWDQYIDREFKGRRIPWRDRQIRRELATRLHDEGMSSRAIGPALGVDHSTVVRDLQATGANAPDDTVQSLDGRDRPASRPVARVVVSPPENRPAEVVRVVVIRDDDAWSRDAHRKLDALARDNRWASIEYWVGSARAVADYAQGLLDSREVESLSPDMFTEDDT
jgi:predicted transcriptional regulator